MRTPRQLVLFVFIHFYFQMTFPQKIRFLMRKRGLSQPRLAQEVAISPGTVNGWLTKDSLPNPATAVKLASFFGISVEQLLDDSFELPVVTSLKAYGADLREQADAARAQYPDNPAAAQESLDRRVERMHYVEELRRAASALNALADDYDSLSAQIGNPPAPVKATAKTVLGRKPGFTRKTTTQRRKAV